MASSGIGVTIVGQAAPGMAQRGRLNEVGGTTGPSNKGMKQTKPSILELRSLSLVFGGRDWQGEGEAE